jgi:glucoamylase
MVLNAFIAHSLAAAAVLVATAAAGNSSSPAQCSKISLDERVDCKKGEADCVDSGCCWQPVNPNPDNRPWCFFSDRKVKKCILSAQPKVPFSDEELQQVRQYFTANLDIQGSGMVVAAPDHNTGPGGDYYFAWMRDGALSMNAYMQTAPAFAEAEKKMDSWLAWVERNQQEADPNGIEILTEPKFVIPSGTPFTGGWCRPQNDGPGLRAITLMALAENKPSVADRVWNVIKADLDWISANYTSDGCDLWEEVHSTDFFWNRFTMRKALLQGAKFAQVKDAARASKYSSIAATIEKALADHVQSDGFVCEANNRCKDTAVIEAFNVGYMGDGVFAPLNKEVIATLLGLSQTFCRDYALNAEAANQGIPGVLFGRYEGDSYAGGNPWVLLTASAANLLYRQAEELAKGTQPTKLAGALLDQLVGGKVTANSLLGAGDAILVLMKKYLSNGMHMNEQIDRNTGALLSAKDLTWNYANVLKAMAARKAAAAAIRSASSASSSVLV